MVLLVLLVLQSLVKHQRGTADLGGALQTCAQSDLHAQHAPNSLCHKRTVSLSSICNVDSGNVSCPAGVHQIVFKEVLSICSAFPLAARQVIKVLASSPSLLLAVCLKSVVS